MKLFNDLEFFLFNKLLDIKEFCYFMLGSERRIRMEVYLE